MPRTGQRSKRKRMVSRADTAQKPFRPKNFWYPRHLLLCISQISNPSDCKCLETVFLCFKTFPLNFTSPPFVAISQLLFCAYFGCSDQLEALFLQATFSLLVSRLPALVAPLVKFPTLLKRFSVVILLPHKFAVAFT